MAAANQLSRTQMFPPPEKKSCMKPCTGWSSTSCRSWRWHGQMTAL